MLLSCVAGDPVLALLVFMCAVSLGITHVSAIHITGSREAN